MCIRLWHEVLLDIVIIRPRRSVKYSVSSLLVQVEFSVCPSVRPSVGPPVTVTTVYFEEKAADWIEMPFEVVGK